VKNSDYQAQGRGGGGWAGREACLPNLCGRDGRRSWASEQIKDLFLRHRPQIGLHGLNHPSVHAVVFNKDKSIYNSHYAVGMNKETVYPNLK